MAFVSDLIKKEKVIIRTLLKNSLKYGVSEAIKKTAEQTNTPVIVVTQISNTFKPEPLAVPITLISELSKKGIRVLDFKKFAGTVDK